MDFRVRTFKKIYIALESWSEIKGKEFSGYKKSNWDKIWVLNLIRLKNILEFLPIFSMKRVLKSIESMSYKYAKLIRKGRVFLDKKYENKNKS